MKSKKTPEQLAKEKANKERKASIEDPLSLEALDGLGPSSIKQLNTKGIFTTFQLIHRDPVWLHHATDYPKEKCADIFKEAKARLQSAGLIDQTEMSGTESLAKRKLVKRVKTDCSSIDGITDGGIELGSCTQVFGEDGGGKTQFVHLMTLQVQRPVAEGGLAEEGQAPPLVYFLATESTWRPERIIEIAAGKGLIIDFPQELRTKVSEGKKLTIEEQAKYDEIKAQREKEAEKYLDNVIIKRVTDPDEQLNAINDLIKMIQEIKFKLIIIDSGVALIRAFYPGQENMNAKFKILNEMLQTLLALAEYNKIAVIFVNQIYINPYPKYGESPEEPFGGKVLGHAFPYIWKIEKSGDGENHRITIIKSPYQGHSSVRFKIDNTGFADIADKKQRELIEE